MAQYTPIPTGFNIRSRTIIDNRFLLSMTEMREEKFIEHGSGTIPLPKAADEAYFAVCSDDKQFYIYDPNSEPSDETGYFHKLNLELRAGEEGQILIYNEAEKVWKPSKFFNDDYFTYTDSGLAIKDYFGGTTGQILIKTGNNWTPAVFYDPNFFVYGTEQGLQLSSFSEAELNQVLCKSNEDSIGWTTITEGEITDDAGLVSTVTLGGINVGKKYEKGEKLETILSDLFTACKVTLGPGRGYGEPQIQYLPKNYKLKLPAFTDLSLNFEEPAQCRFDYWNCEGHAYLPGDEVDIGDTSNFVIEATYKEIQTLTLLFNPTQGGGEMPPWTVEKGVSSVIPDVDFIKPLKYTFLGWLLKDDQIIFPGDTFTFTEGDDGPGSTTITLRAKWRLEKLQIVFTNGLVDEEVYEDYVVESPPSVYILPTCTFKPEDETKEFDHWRYINTTEPKLYPGDRLVLDREDGELEIRLEAVWKDA